MSLDRETLLAFLRDHRLGVVASSTEGGDPQAALVGYAVTDGLELVFDTSARSRKAANIASRPRVAMVIGWEDEATLQLEGPADQPTGAALERCRASYLEAYPDGRDREDAPDITYIRVRPDWIRLSRFGSPAPEVAEISNAELATIVRPR